MIIKITPLIKQFKVLLLQAFLPSVHGKVRDTSPWPDAAVVQMRLREDCPF